MNIKKDTVIFMMKRFDIPEAETITMFAVGLLDERVCRDVLIRDEYFNSVEYIQKTKLKKQLAEKYNTCMSTIEKALIRKQKSYSEIN